ncbi:L-threonylcarbamoyladenylate synthase [Bacteroidota bacterium]
MQSDLFNSLITLRKGGVILYPTDTIWGIGCDATNSNAIERINIIKKRSKKKHFIVLIESEKFLKKYVKKIPENVLALLENYDSSITIIYPGAKNLPASIIAPDGSIGIRIIQDPFCASLIKKLGNPIVSTSANVSDEPSPVYFSDIKDEIKSQVDYIVKWRQQDKNMPRPSRIIKVHESGDFTVIRE